MKLLVACALRVSFAARLCTLLITTTAFLVTMVPAQTSQRRASKRASNQTRSTSAQPATLKICQGVPVPPGYVIIAYITSSACPHGAYVIKKQDAYSESVAEAYTKPKRTSNGSAPATSTVQPTVPTTNVARRSSQPSELSDSEHSRRG